MGSICSILLFIVVISYSYLKADILVTRKAGHVLSTINEFAYDQDYIFSFDNGFNVAAALTTFDQTPLESIIDDSIGELVFNQIMWNYEDKSKQYDRKMIPSHTCTDEEMGIEED